MTIRQSLQEVLNDYNYMSKMGEKPATTAAMLKMQLAELIEFEKHEAYDMGMESGQHGAFHDLWLKAVMAGKSQQFNELMELTKEERVKVNA